MFTRGYTPDPQRGGEHHLLEKTNFTGVKPGVSEWLILCSKCAKTHLRASGVQKNFLGSLSLAIRGGDYVGNGGEGRGEEGMGREGRRGEGRGGNGRGGDGTVRTPQLSKPAAAPGPIPTSYKWFVVMFCINLSVFESLAKFRFGHYRGEP
jgi:hypothetical protein